MNTEADKIAAYARHLEGALAASENRAKELDAATDKLRRDVEATMAAADELQQQVSDLMQLNQDMSGYVRYLERELQTRTAELATRDDDATVLRARVEQGEHVIAERVKAIDAAVARLERRAPDAGSDIDVTDAATIAELEQRLAQAWVAGDRPFIEDLLAPEWTVTGGVLYEQPIGGDLRALFYLDARWQDEYRTQTLNRHPLGLTDNEAFAIVNGRIGIGPDNERWSVEFWGRNLTDETYFVGAFVPPLQNSFVVFPNEPATYGVTLRARY